MDHGDAAALFSAHHDNELSEGERAELERHLAGCAPCKSDYDAFVAAVSAVSNLRQAAPTNFETQVKGQIRTRSRGRFFARPAPRLNQMTLSLISLVTLLIAAILYLAARFLN